jgi:hypothetical protein
MFQQLDPRRIVETAARLQQRIGERFPASGLSGIAVELCEVARATQAVERWLAKPLYPVRVAVAFLSIALVGAVILTLTQMQLDLVDAGFVDFVQGVEAFINDLIFVALAIYFLVGLERRFKRRRALRELHVLRSMAHIIDLHQLSKDPEQLAETVTQGAPAALTPLQMARYLDYCSELLAVAGKIAAIYVQRFDDAETLAAAGDVETLTVGLSQKVWQKISILNRVMAPQRGL